MCHLVATDNAAHGLGQLKEVVCYRRLCNRPLSLLQSIQSLVGESYDSVSMSVYVAAANNYRG